MCGLVEVEWQLTNAAEYFYFAAFFHLAFCVTRTITVPLRLYQARNIWKYAYGTSEGNDTLTQSDLLIRCL
jgi:hypothetical protein